MTTHTTPQWCSPEIDKITSALVQAQSTFGPVVKDKKATVKGASKSTGKEYDRSYSYANLESTLIACLSALNDNDIFVMQLPAASTRNGIEVTTRLLHSSGQWIQSEPLFMPVSGGAQDVGSAITYGRRYQLLAMLGLAPTEDDDGDRAQGAKPDSWRNAPRAPERPPAPADELGPRCVGRWEHIATANTKLLGELSEVLGEDMGKVYRSALKGAGVDLPKYGRKLPGSAALTVVDGQLVKAKLEAKLAEVSREPGDDADDDITAGGAP